MLKEKTKMVISRMHNISLPIVAIATTVGITTTQMLVVNADATALMETIIKIIAKLIIAAGVIYAVFGLVHYAAANSEGDGPAKNKAVQQLVAAAMLIVLSIILMAVAPTLAGMLETSI